MLAQDKQIYSPLKDSTQIFLPLLLYVICSRIFQAVCSILLPPEVLLEHPAAFLGLENLLFLPLFYVGFYRQDLRHRAIRRDEKIKNGKNLQYFWRRGKTALLIAGASLCLSRGLNQVLSLTLLKERFPAYETATAAVYAEALWVQVLVTVVSAPLLEELLMRGIVYERMRERTGNLRLAVLGSALIFGIFHGNVVQGIYAFFLGVLFAWLLERCGGLWAPILAHAVINGGALIQNRLPWLPGMTAGQRLAAVCFSGAAFLLAGYGLLKRIPREM